MIASLNIQGDKFTIDFSKINEFKENSALGSSRVHIEQSFEDADNMGDFREDFSEIQTSKYEDQSHFISEREDLASQSMAPSDIVVQSVASKKSANTSKLSIEMTKKHKAAIKIQKVIRGYLVRTNDEYRNKSFRNISQDPNEKLKIMER